MPDTSVTAYIALGSNLGDRANNLNQALCLLERHPDIQELSVSSFYETEPVGDADQGWFVNAAARLTTSLSAEALLALCLDIERQMGRIREEARRNGPRTLDLDLLFYGEQSLNTPTLSIPHPALHQRAFVLAPLAELAPNLQHPLLHQSIAELYSNLPIGEAVRPMLTGTPS